MIKYSSRKNPLPFYISIGKNEYFFAKIEWLLFKHFNKKRSIPCGRGKKDKYLCCCQPIDAEHCYISEDAHKIYCKCCESTRAIGNKPIIGFDDLW